MQPYQAQPELSQSTIERLQRSFLLHSVFTVVIVCLVVTVAITIPTVNKQVRHDEEEVLHLLQLRALAIDEYLARVREIAAQISSRTTARLALDAYNRGELEAGELAVVSKPILQDALDRSNEVVGISRLGADGRPALQQGLALPEEVFPAKAAGAASTQFRGLTEIDGKLHLLIVSPILGNDHRRVGTDVIVFDASALKRIVEDSRGLRRTGATALGMFTSDGIRILSSFDSVGGRLPTFLPGNEGIGKVLFEGRGRASGMGTARNPDGRSILVAYSRIRDTDWIALLKITRGELYESLPGDISLIVLLVASIVALGLLVMLRKLRPLMVKVSDHTTVMGQEIEERKRSEAHVLARAEQQAIVAELGQDALRGLPPQDLMDRAVSLLARTLDVEYAKVLELLPGGEGLRLRAGVGWREGLTGTAVVSAGKESQAGYTLLSDGPVVVEDLESEKRFSGPPLLSNHGVKSGASVVIRGKEAPFGVLGVHSRSRRTFSEKDLHFLQSIANVLGESIVRTEAEAALALNEMRLRAVFASALDPLITADAAGIIQSASDSVERCFGWHPREIIGQSLDLMFSEGIHRIYQRDLDASLQANEPRLLGRTNEITARRKDGSSFPCEISVSKVTLPGQAATLFTSIVRDITDRRESERQLRELVELIEASPDLIGLASLEGSVLYLNRAGRQMVGLESAAEVKGTTIFDYLPETVRDEFREYVLSRALSGNGYVEKEFELRNFRSEETISARGKLFLIKDSSTEKPLAIATVVSDIRGSKKAEADLRASEARFRRFMESLPQGVVVHRAGRIIYANPAAATMLGFAGTEEALGSEIITFVHPDERQRSMDGIRAMYETGEPAPLAEVTLKARDGRQFPAELRAIPVEFDGQRAILGVFADLTERRQLQTRLAQADRLASVGLLAAGVAHEINNPLSYVIANLDFVSEQLSRWKGRAPGSPEFPDDAASVDEMNEILREARSGAERVKGIVKDLRTFSRTDEDTGAPIELRSVIDSTLNMAFKSIRSEARIIKRYGDTPRVAGNEARLGQVFMNLVQNAAQSLDKKRPGGNEIRVATRTDARGRACVEITDTGRGIDEETLPRIFDPFFTTKPVGLGTGLGLSICRNIIDALNGEISVDSRPGEGTTVCVVLPPAESRRRPRSTTVTPGPSDDPGRARVLVVDDDPALGASLRRNLSVSHDVVVVTGCDDALALIREDPDFDVVLCDVMMPGKSGMDLYETVLKARPDLAERFVFMTGGAFTDSAREFLEQVDNEVIEKPFDMRHIRTFLGSFARPRS